MTYSVFCKYAAETALAIKARTELANPENFGLDDDIRDPVSLGHDWDYKARTNEYFNTVAATRLQKALRDRAAGNLGGAVTPEASQDPTAEMGMLQAMSQKFSQLDLLLLYKYANDRKHPALADKVELPPQNVIADSFSGPLDPNESLELSLRAYDEIAPNSGDQFLDPRVERSLRNRAFSYIGQEAGTFAQKAAPGTHGEIGTAVNLGLRTLALQAEEARKNRRRRIQGSIFIDPVPVQYQGAPGPGNAPSEAADASGRHKSLRDRMASV